MRPTQLLLPLIALQGCALFELAAIRRSFPPETGAFQVEGMRDFVTVARDDYGVPHIRASNAEDAWAGLGFMHGQDRFFQADLLRHIAWGRTAEWLGEGAADLDGFMRTLDLRARARRNVQLLDPDTLAILQAYTEGMNAGIASLEVPPIEHRLLNSDPEPWEVVDCYASLMLQSYNLAGNPTQEVFTWTHRDELDRDTLDRLFRWYDETPPIDPFWDQLRQARTDDFTDAFKAFGDTLGGNPDATEASNNWIVGPELSASGLPILANDPHLSQAVPGLWYVADLAGGDLHVAGATLAGSPGVPIGHTDGFAWGLTNVQADVVDLVVLERDGDGYVLGGETKTFEEVTHEILTSKGDLVTRTNLRTELGPVITGPGGTHVVVMRWNALEVDDQLPLVLRGLAEAQTVDDGLAAIARPAIVAQNVLMADTTGEFAWQAQGSIPKRIAHTGRVPYPGSDPAHGWDGSLALLPGERNPERGYVLTANARPRSDVTAAGEGPVPVDAISTYYTPNHRHDRIDALLSEGGPFTADDVRAQQLDVLDVFARDTLPGWLEGVVPRGVGVPCGEALAAWDFRWEADSVGAAVWGVTQEHLMRRVLGRTLSPEAVDGYLGSTSSGRTLIHGDLESFTPDLADDMEAALIDACTELTAVLGEDPAAWTWGAMHPLALKHPVANGRALLNRWHLPEVPFRGAGTTVAAANWNYTDTGPYPVKGMASLRLVVPLDDVTAATLVHPGGQSGHPRHPDTTTHFDAFLAGEGVPLRYSDADVDAFTVSELVLEP